MNSDAIITLLVTFVALVLFLTEVYPIDVVALGIMTVLVATGVITPTEGVRGFANSATITIGAMFVVSDSLIRTGLIQNVRPLFGRLLSAGYKRTIAVMSTLVGGISAFINNTPVVATCIPIVSTTANNNGVLPSRYLIPLSFGAIFGGTCTLIGTSTNLLVNGIAQDAGLRGFSMFLLTPLGLVFGLVGTLYLVFLGPRLVAERPAAEEFEEKKKIKKFEAEVKVTGRPDTDAKTVDDVFGEEGDRSSIELLQVKRGDRITQAPSGRFKLQMDDLLHIEGDMETIQRLLKTDFFQISEQEGEERFPNETTRLVEIVLLPNSEIIDRKLKQMRFLGKYSAEVLAIRSRGEAHFKDLDDIILHSGDILLLQTNEQGLEQMRQMEMHEKAPFISLRETAPQSVRSKDLAIVTLTLAGIVGLAAFQVLPIMMAALGGVAVLAFTRTISMSQAYRAIDWKVIVLIAGALSLGTAMQSSGIADKMATLLVEGIGPALGPVAVVSALYLATSVFTELMSNNAAAAILAPIAISAAAALEVDPTPLLLAVAFAGSASFMTPVGYQTNTMVYSAGNYRFTDFTKVGLPLNCVFWILATWLIPVFYPF